MPTSTTNFGLSKPLVNDVTDQDLWGGELNTDLDSIDTLLLTCLNTSVTGKSANYTVVAPTSGSTTTGDAGKLLTGNASGGIFTFTLPQASTCAGMRVAFKKIDSSSNAITLAAFAGDNIDGQASFSLTSQYNYVILVCTGSVWEIISQTPPSVTQPIIRLQAITATGNFTAPVGTVASTAFKFTFSGGGAAGGGATATGGGAGGGSGSTAIYIATGLTAGANYAVTIGAGGTGVSASTGNSGGNSTVVINATTVTAPGGTGGGVASGSSGGNGGAGGGACTNATASIQGGGGDSSNNSGGTASGGAGGASFWGGGGPAIGALGASGGVAGTAYGSGGGGGWTNGGDVAGGNGAAGFCLVEWIL